ncbi:MAG: tRNA pseudouridine(38-40) synthase TruA [Verrucomicrobiota bacterium]|nr:tRNA pseudouridine(38-40) synthase TruA [Verrucomicrobiota bacterium]
MPRRLRFIVGYDGRPFAGWQSQASGNTIQDLLETAFASIAQQRVRVHGAGRTDAGVHALAQSAHADVPESRLSPELWAAALNASLPPTIRVLRSRFVTEAFHARFAAKGKLYRYRVWNDRILPPLEFGRAWQVARPLDREKMRREAKLFVGRQDFASFAANRGHSVDDTVRTIEFVRLRERGPELELSISGDGFLYKMVRLMVGALVRGASGQAAAGEIAERLHNPKRFLARARFVAPADGLYLVRVKY